MALDARGAGGAAVCSSFLSVYLPINRIPPKYPRTREGVYAFPNHIRRSRREWTYIYSVKIFGFSSNSTPVTERVPRRAPKLLIYDAADRFERRLGLAPEHKRAIDLHSGLLTVIKIDNADNVIFARPTPDRVNQFAERSLWPKQVFASTHGQALNYFAFSDDALGPVFDRMVQEGASIVRDIQADRRHGPMSFLTRGPSYLLIEIVQSTYPREQLVKQIGDQGNGRNLSSAPCPQSERFHHNFLTSGRRPFKIATYATCSEPVDESPEVRIGAVSRRSAIGRRSPNSYR